jgi:hypothetical protein
MMAAVTSAVLAVPPTSRVRMPLPEVTSMACWTALASSCRPKCSSISAALPMAPTGLQIPWPAMSGAEPWTGSNIDG